MTLERKLPRMTLQRQLFVRVLLEEPTRYRYGRELSEMLGLPSGTIYPMLAHFEELKWIESKWEDEKVHLTEGRPRRRYYRLTPDGAELARHALALTVKRFRLRGRIV